MSAPGSPTAAPAAPAMHPLDPRRGENLSPFAGLTRPHWGHGPGSLAAVLSWALQLPPVTTPAVTGIPVSGNCVFAATDADPFHDTSIGDFRDLRRNLRDWGTVCGADDEAIDGLIAKFRSAGT